MIDLEYKRIMSVYRVNDGNHKKFVLTKEELSRTSYYNSRMSEHKDSQARSEAIHFGGVYSGRTPPEERQIKTINN